jgi:hypothetical protein
MIPKAVFMAKYHTYLEGLLARSSVRVACLADAPDVILGYVVSHGESLDWVFVKNRWRGIGIAKALVSPLAAKSVSHLTPVGKSLLKKLTGVYFDPFT